MRVVTGCKTFSADLAGHAQKGFKFHIRIAIRTGNGRAASKIVVHEGADHARLELFFEVHNVMREIEVLGDALRVVDVFERAAAVLCGAGALQFGEATLVPKLHGETDDRPAP